MRQDSDLGLLVANQHVSRLIESGRVNPETLAETEHAIQDSLRTFERLLDGNTAQVNGGVAA